MNSINYNFPFKIDNKTNKTSTTDHASHIRQLIEVVLFTSPGERVNRPTFGSGLNQLIFAANSDELSTATQFLVQGALQQWLGHLIKVESVVVKNDSSKLNISIQYVINTDQQRHVSEFVKDVSND